MDFRLKYSTLVQKFNNVNHSCHDCLSDRTILVIPLSQELKQKQSLSFNSKTPSAAAKSIEYNPDNMKGQHIPNSTHICYYTCYSLIRNCGCSTQQHLSFVFIVFLSSSPSHNALSPLTAAQVQPFFSWLPNTSQYSGAFLSQPHHMCS